MFDLFFITTVAIMIVLGFYAITYSIVWIADKCVSWLIRLLRMDKNKKEQIKGNTMVGGAKNGF